MGSSQSNQNLDTENAKKQLETAEMKFDEITQSMESLVEEAKNAHNLHRYLGVMNRFVSFFDIGVQCQEFGNVAKNASLSVQNFNRLLDDTEIREIVSLERIQNARRIYSKFWELKKSTINVVQKLSRDIRLCSLTLRGIDRELQNGKNSDSKKMAEYMKRLSNWFEQSQQTQNLANDWNTLWKEATDEHDLWEDAIKKFQSTVTSKKYVIFTATLAALSCIAVGVVFVLAPHCAIAVAIVCGIYSVSSFSCAASFMWYRFKLRRRSQKTFAAIANSAQNISKIMKELAEECLRVEEHMMEPLKILSTDQKNDFVIIAQAIGDDDIEECEKTIKILQGRFENFGKKCEEVIAFLSNDNLTTFEKKNAQIHHFY